VTDGLELFHDSVGSRIRVGKQRSNRNAGYWYPVGERGASAKGQPHTVEPPHERWRKSHGAELGLEPIERTALAGYLGCGPLRILQLGQGDGDFNLAYSETEVAKRLDDPAGGRSTAAAQRISGRAINVLGVDYDGGVHLVD
jgi:hypothetical protein